jgi:hypothetical protein
MLIAAEIRRKAEEDENERGSRELARVVCTHSTNAYSTAPPPREPLLLIVRKLAANAVHKSLRISSW